MRKAFGKNSGSSLLIPVNDFCLGENVTRGQYKIVQATCVSLTEDIREHEDGTEVFYITEFSNGETQTLRYSLGIKGDIFYLVYLPEAKTANAIFKGIEYIPSADLVIEKQ